MYKKLTLNTMLFFSTLICVAPTMAEVAIVANSASGASALDAKAARNLFLGKTKSLPGMGDFTLVSQAERSATAAEFSEKVVKKSLVQFKAYISKKVFAGKITPPIEKFNDAEVKAYIASHANAIGYLDVSAVDDTVKVLFRAP